MPQHRLQKHIRRSRANDSAGSSLKLAYEPSVYSWPVTNSGGFLYQGTPMPPMTYTFSNQPNLISPVFGYIPPPPTTNTSYARIQAEAKGRVREAKNKHYVSVL